MKEKVYFKIKDCWKGVKFPTIERRIEALLEHYTQTKQYESYKKLEDFLSEIACEKGLKCNIVVSDIKRVPEIGEKIEFNGHNVFGWGEKTLNTSEIFPRRDGEPDEKYHERFSKFVSEYGFITSNFQNFEKDFDHIGSTILCNINVLYRVIDVKTEYGFLDELGTLRYCKQTDRKTTTVTLDVYR